MTEPLNHYDSLQIAQSASGAVIRAAYRALSQENHPDKNLNDQQDANRKMKVVNEACVVLSDPIRRREYDKEIDQKRAAAVTSSIGGFIKNASKKDRAWMMAALVLSAFFEKKK